MPPAGGRPDMHLADFRQTVLSGGLRVAFPLACWIYIARHIVQQHSVQLLGVWGLLASIVALAGSLGSGFESYFRRTGLPALPPDARKDVMHEMCAAVWLTNRLVVLVGAVLLALAPWLAEKNSAYIGQPELLSAILMLWLGAALGLRNQLAGSLLTSLGQTHRCRQAELIASLGFNGIALLATRTDYLLAGLALGRLLESGLLHFLLRYHLRPTGLLSELKSSPATSTRSRRQIIRKVAPFFLFSLAVQSRHTFMTVSINSVFGFAMGGSWDLAMRISSAIRNVSGVATSSLHSSFATQYRSGDMAGLRRLLMTAFAVSLLIGLPALLVIRWRTPMLELWLDTVPANLELVLPAVMAWTAFNVLLSPFVIFLLSTGRERLCLTNSWSVFGLSVFLMGLAWGGWLNFAGVLAGWIIISVGSQLILSIRVARELHPWRT
jgi:O-antigen/teichoic acid export membrane protein